MINQFKYDLAIIGGGLAGLGLAIQSANAGYATVLFEKETYPFHRVCGEYISMESWNFLEGLGLPLKDMKLPLINTLMVSAPDGKSIEHQLPLGGFGISRYSIDYHLAGIARERGVSLMESTKVSDISYNNIFTITTTKGNFFAKTAAGAFGKLSNLDIKWNRPFIQKRPNKLNNYIGVKYHIKTDWPENKIALHNFQNGYCGISAVENSIYCLCYLTSAKNLNSSNNTIETMEKKILYRNPFLKNIFINSEFIFEQPLTISRISFEKKALVEHDVLLLGDAAGMITPLCGNGMSMALHASKLAFKQIDSYLKEKINFMEMERAYEQEWKTNFAARLRTGRLIQSFFGNNILSEILIRSLKPFPNITSRIIRKTHGSPF